MNFSLALRLLQKKQFLSLLNEGFETELKFSFVNSVVLIKLFIKERTLFLLEGSIRLMLKNGSKNVATVNTSFLRRLENRLVNLMCKSYNVYLITNYW